MDSDARPSSQAPGGRHVINEKSIVFDVLDGEVVIVNLDSGAYYILEGTASTIWQLIAAGTPEPHIVDALMRLHAGERPVAESSTAAFLAQLIEESLLVPADAAPDPVARPFDENLAVEKGRPFVPPVMYRYTDMQALIQMDPIREYDETGWPRRRPVPPPRT